MADGRLHSVFRASKQRRTLGLLLAAVLLLAQIAAAAHGTDLERHRAHDQCQTCLLLANAGSGVPSTTSLVLLATVCAVAVTPCTVPLPAQRRLSFHIRAPPLPTL